MADMAHLIEPVIPALRRYARTFVRGAADADDLVQDTLERAISRWHQRRSDGETQKGRRGRLVRTSRPRAAVNNHEQIFNLNRRSLHSFPKQTPKCLASASDGETEMTRFKV